MNVTENQRCSCKIKIRSPRNLSPVVVWSFYAVNVFFGILNLIFLMNCNLLCKYFITNNYKIFKAIFVGLLTSIIIIFVKQNNSEEIKIRLANIKKDLKNYEKLGTSLNSLIHYKSLLHKNFKNISWIDGSNDEIYYRDSNLNLVILNATKVRENSKRLIKLRIKIRETFSQNEYFLQTSFNDENLIISPGKLYIAILTDVKKSFTESPKYRVNIKEFRSGIEKKIVKNNNFVSNFAFSDQDHLYFYTYNDNGFEKHYKCFLNHADLNITIEFCQTEFDYSKKRRLDSPNQKEYCSHDGSIVRCNSMIDGILYKENGTVLLYPKINTFVYNRAITNYKLKISKNKTTRKPEIIDFGMTRQRTDQIHYSSYREESEYKSIEYSVHYPDEAAVFYGLQGNNYSYYFPSKEQAFFIEPAYGIIQLDSKPWVLHPFIYHNETTGMSTFNMAISTNDGVDEKSEDIDYINSTTGNFIPLISSEYYVTEILKVRKDEKTGDLFAYFLAAPTRNVSRRNFYKIKIPHVFNETTSTESVICLTCPEEKSDGGLETSEIHPKCLWADVKMSSLGDYYLLHCKGPDVPWTVIVNTQTNIVLFNLNENEEIRAWDSLITKPRIHEFEMELEDGFIGRVRMYFPFEWDPEMKTCPEKYKLLLHVDGTPESQLVTAKYQISWLWELILNKNFIVVEADVRGSGYQNIEISSSIWREIGTWEIEDQISVINNILGRFNCIDPNQVAVYGEAHGGYTALNIMAMDGNNIFKCCAAVSPITTWQHYSHDFAIKMFGGKYNNITKSSYEEANLSSRISGLRDKNFIIYSATMDQKILRYHVNNFLIALAEKGILFKHQQYIDEGHDISNYRVHLYKHIDEYFENCFAKKN